MSNHLEIGKNKIPITGYDLLGYLIPGSFLIALIFLFEYIVKQQYKELGIITPIFDSVYSLFHYKTHGFLSVALLLLAVYIVIYMTGHAVASVSSVLADHWLVSKGHGYPYESLLGLKDLNNSNQIITQGFYLGGFFWLNVYIALKFFSFSRGSSNLFYIPRTIAYYILFTLAIKLLYHQRVIKPEAFKASQIGKFIAYFLRKIHPGPYLLIQNLLLKMFNTRTRFNEDFIAGYRVKFLRRFNLDYKNAGTNNFWLSYIYVISNCPESAPLITNWLHLYAFARNVSISFYLVLFYMVVDFKIQRPIFLAKPSSQTYLLALLFLSLGILFLSRYIYLYFSYFSKFTFRAFCAHQETMEPESEA